MSTIKKILVTGNLGYVGSVLVEQLVREKYEVVGYDTEYYGKECLLYDYVPSVVRQIKKDIRDVESQDLEGIDAVIHLAALSNDPLGEFDPILTHAINYEATLKLAHLARAVQVKRFIFASSQSMYGVSNTDAELGEDNSEKNPVTMYAKTKWEAECALKAMNEPDFSVVCFRPSTVFGASPKLRCDIVYNSLVASAHTTRKIEIKSDGTPWRPVVHVKDVCNAFIAGLKAPAALVAGESFNVGIENGNFTVKDLALAAQSVVLGSKLTFTGEHGSDARTYRVGFKKIFSVLKGYYNPEWNLTKGGRELVHLFKESNFEEKDFRGTRCNRLPVLKNLLQKERLDSQLRWISGRGQ